jgi:hypothetical protein
MKIAIRALRKIINEELSVVKLDESVVRRFNVYLSKSPDDAKKYLWRAIKDNLVTESDFLECLSDMETKR